MTSGIIHVYAGKGSSHSWTWLADLFDSAGFIDVRFLESEEFAKLKGNRVSVVIVSGGDGFEIAYALGRSGFSKLEDYVRCGGTYVGICAGAYLPLHSTIEPFSAFNLSSTKIENIENTPSPSLTSSPRLGVRYGSCTIIHPVRGEVQVAFGDGLLEAPIFGGPVFREPSQDEVLARYHGLADATELQVDRHVAEGIIRGKPAVIRTRYGDGQLLLFGPHLEHPRFPLANAKFLSMLGIQAVRRARRDVPAVDRSLARAVADLKVAILGLENRSFLVGNKLWDGGRFLELVSAIEKRMESAGSSVAEQVTEMLLAVRDEIIGSKPQSLLFADEGPEHLVEAARLIVDNHFSVLSAFRDR